MPCTGINDVCRTAAIDFINRLNRALMGHPEASFANPLFNRAFRRGFLSEVLRLVLATDPDQISYYTFVSADWRYPPQTSSSANPRRVREALRAELNRLGQLSSREGWFIVFYDNLLDTGLNLYTPHFHIIAFGNKRQAFEALRGSPRFQTDASPYRPIQCDPLGNAVRQTAYLFKPYVLAQHSKPNVGKPGRQRVGKPRRLPTALLATWLLETDRISFADVIWMNGVALHDGQLVVNTNA